MKTVKVGPVGLVDTVVEISNDLSEKDKKKFLLDIGAGKEIQRKLDLIKKLMNHAKAYEIIDKLSF